MIDAGSLLGARDLAPELERELEMALRGRRRGSCGGSAPRPDRRGQRAWQIVGSQPVVGEHRVGVQVRARQLGTVLDCLRVGPV